MRRSHRASGPGAIALCLALAGHALGADETAPAADGAYARSLLLARQALLRRPGDEGLLRVLANVHFRQGKFRDAIAAFEEVLRGQPASREARLGLAQSYFQLEDFEGAEREFLNLIAGGESQQTAQARRDLAEIRFRRGQYAEAAELLRNAIDRGDRGARMWFLLGRAYEAAAREGRAKTRAREEIAKAESEAMAALAEALRIDPTESQAHYVMASIARRQGDAKAAAAALEAFRQSKSAAPSIDAAGAARAEAVFEARTAIELGRSLLAAGDANGARGFAAHALKVQTDFTEALALQGWIALQSGQSEEAAATYRRILEREPGHAEALWNLGRLRMKAGDLEAAVPLLLQAAEARPGFADGWELLLQLAEQHGILADRVEELAAKALRARPSAANYARLAVALFGRGKLEDCRRVLEEGLRRHPGDADLVAAQSTLREAPAAK